ncbi:topology modulation protein [Halobacillus andaensis]|uniref:topology modulation protein n=1 Tax=Halobacillus andaensis TaxID=1176239 RepID=UPI003D711E46
MLQIEVVHMDTLFWKPGWLQSTPEELLAKQEIHLKKSSWIIEGNYSSVWEKRLKTADTVIFLDMNRYLCIYRALKRWMKYRGTIREDLGPGCPDRMNIEFLSYIWQFPNQRRDKVIKNTFDQCRHAQIFLIKNKQGTDKLVNQIISLNT